MFDDISQVRYTDFTGKTVLLRMIEGLGYRFNRAVTGFLPEHLNAKPVPSGFSVAELTAHIGHLIQTSRSVFEQKKPSHTECSIEDVRAEIARLYEAVSARDDEELGKITTSKCDSVFYLVNGPLSDALWHMGQLAVYKRLLGVQSPNGGYFKGQRV